MDQRERKRIEKAVEKAPRHSSGMIHPNQVVTLLQREAAYQRARVRRIVQKQKNRRSALDIEAMTPASAYDAALTATPAGKGDKCSR